LKETERKTKKEEEENSEEIKKNEKVS